MTKSIDQHLPPKIKRFEDHLHGKEGQILLATFKCIADIGIAATSTRAIAERAGLNQGIIHYYFRSKDHLLKSVLEILFLNSTSNIEAVASSSLPPLEKLDGILQAGLSLIGRRREEFIVFVAFWGHAMSVGGDLLRLYQNLFRRFRGAFVKIIKEGENKSEFKPGMNKEMALLIVGAVEGLGLQCVMDPKQVNLEGVTSLLRNLVQFALKR